MKKIIIVIVALATTLISCKKEQAPAEIQSQVVLKKTTSPNLTITSPRTRISALNFSLEVRNTPGTVLTDAMVSLKATDGLNLNDIRNVGIVIGGDTITLANSGAQVPEYHGNIPLGNPSTNSIAVVVDVLNPSTHGTLSGSLQIGYITDAYVSGGHFGTETVQGQSTTFTTTSLTVSASNATPPEGTILSNGVRESVRFFAKAVGQAHTPKSVQVQFNGAFVQETRVYIAGTNTLLGMATNSQTGMITKAIALYSPTINDGDSVELSIQQVMAVITSPTIGQPDIKTTVISLTYISSDSVTRTNNTVITGNSLYVYNSFPYISTIPITTPPPVNGIPYVFVKGVVKSIGGNGAYKHFTIDVRIVDMGALDAIGLKSLKLKVSNSYATNVAYFNEAGVQIDSITSSGKVTVEFISGPGQELQVTNTETLIEFEATMYGSNHPGSGDYISTQLLGDDSPVPASFKFLNRGGVPGTTLTSAKLYNSVTPSASAVYANTLYSDLEAVGTHSGAIGANSMDWIDVSRFYKNTNPTPRIDYFYL